MDYFKVVLTRERKGMYFTAVPNQWENNNILYWPEHLIHSEREGLRSNPKSSPEPTWVQYACIVKCSKIMNFKIALQMEKQLTECSDTEAEEMIFMNISKQKEATVKGSSEQVFDRNSKFLELNNLNDNLPTEEILIVQNNEVVNHRLNEAQLITLPNLQTNEEISNIRTELAEIKEKLSNIRMEIKQNYAKVNVNLDKIYNLISTNEWRTTSDNAKNQTTPKEDLLEKYSFPLSSCEDITALNKDIESNPEFKIQLITALSEIGGTSGESDGSKIAYKITDSVFRSDILMKYSWTGVSRLNKTKPETKPEEKKISFQLLEGIVEVHYEAILLADNRHTKEKNANIFKEGILKHAKKRSQRKRLRRHLDNMDDSNNDINNDNANNNKIDNNNETENNNEAASNNEIVHIEIHQEDDSQ